MELRVSKENEVKGGLQEKRVSEAWMDSLGSLESQEHREDLDLLVWQDPRERREMWGRQDPPACQALWCTERA